MSELAKGDNAPFQRQPLTTRFCNLERLVDALEARGLDGIVATTPLNVFYLSGFNGIAHKSDEPRPYAVIVSRHTPEHPIMVIADNSMYGTIGMHSYMRYPDRKFMDGTRLTNPDFAAWARSFGAEAITIAKEFDVADGIAQAFAVKTRPVVVHCLTSALQMSAWRRYADADSLP